MLIYRLQNGSELKAATTYKQSIPDPKKPLGFDIFGKPVYELEKESNNSGINPSDVLLTPARAVKGATKLLPKSLTTEEKVVDIITKTKNQANNTTNEINKLKADKPKLNSLGKNKFLSGERAAKDLEVDLPYMPTEVFNNKILIRRTL